jgi:type II secretory pathway component GspD/PulD (secretin)
MVNPTGQPRFPRHRNRTIVPKLIVLAGKDLMPDIEDLVGRLDVTAPENTGKINVYYLENVDAEELAKVLSSLQSRVPLFGDFPLLGYLFRFKSVRSRTNLLVFLTPRVIKEPRKITELTEDRKKKMDAFVEQNEGEVEGAHPL